MRVGLLPDSPVDAFAQQVRVTAVPRILLDPVHQDLSYGDAVLADAFTEVHMTGERSVGFGLLARQSGPSSSDIVDGGTERRAICSAVKPSHFLRTVSRYVAR